jgi:hemoglobin
MTEKTLYERLGGKEAIAAVVGKMYDKILSDTLLKPFFQDIDMAHLRKSQISFVAMAFGAPHGYTGQHLREAHLPLVKRGLSGIHFDAVAQHLAEAMAELGVTKDLINEAIGIVSTTRNDVLSL